MNPDSKNFDALRRLLALKRHEQPPPGYFNNFSSQVIARIKAGEHGEPASLIRRLFGEAAWWQRLSAAVEAKPAFAGAFGAAVCALLISGLVYSENGPTLAAQGLMASETSSFLTPTAVAMNDSLDQVQFVSSSTNPIAPPAGSLFHQIQIPTQPVSFQMPGY
jgi:hypothetical protein